MSTSQKERRDCSDLKAQVKAELSGQVDSEIIAVNSDLYSELLAKFDAPPRPNARLRRALTTKAPWEAAEKGVSSGENETRVNEAAE